MTELSFPEEPITRRSLLRRMFQIGVVATAAAGLGEIFGVAPAGAEYRAFHTPNQGPPCSCMVSCTIAEHMCQQNPCPPGYCCYHCTGCGDDYYACINYMDLGQGCEITGFKMCPP